MNNATNLRQNVSKALSKLRKAGLSSDATSGGALIPYHLSKEIVNGVRYLNPIPQYVNMFSMFDGGQNGSDKYEYSRVSALRKQGSFGAERAIPTARSFQSERLQNYLKVSKTQTSVWGFTENITRTFLDSVSMALQQEARASSLDFAMRYIYDNRKAMYKDNTKNFGAWEDSFDQSINTTSNRLQKFTAGAPSVLTTAMLDEMIQVSNLAVGFAGQYNDRKRVFLMSPALANKVKDLQAVGSTRFNFNVPNQDPSYLPYIQHAGFYLASYMGIPIVEMQGLGGSTSGAMGTVTPSAVTATSALSAATYYAQVSKVTINAAGSGTENTFGESMASAEVSQAIAGTTETLRLTIPADEDALYYKVYLSQSTGLASKKLVGVFPAKTYDDDGNIIGNVTATNDGTLAYKQVSSNASGLVTSIDIYYDSTASAANLENMGVFGAMSNDIPLTAVSSVNGENIILWDTTEKEAAADFYFADDTPDNTGGFMTIQELSIIADRKDFLFKSYATPVFRFPDSTVMARGVRAS